MQLYNLLRLRELLKFSCLLVRHDVLKIQILILLSDKMLTSKNTVLGKLLGWR